MERKGHPQSRGLTFAEVTEFFDLDDPSRERLELYARLLDKDARRLGLIGFAVETIPEHISRALLLTQATAAGPFIDVGSGAGLPGVPLAVARAGEACLVEPKGKAVAFLEKVARELELSVEVLPVRAQEAVTAGRLAPNVVARALAEPARALDLCLPLCSPGGRVLLTSGPHASENVPDRMAATDLTGPLDIVQRILMIDTSSPQPGSDSDHRSERGQ